MSLDDTLEEKSEQLRGFLSNLTQRKLIGFIAVHAFIIAFITTGYFPAVNIDGTGLFTIAYLSFLFACSVTAFKAPNAMFLMRAGLASFVAFVCQWQFMAMIEPNSGFKPIIPWDAHWLAMVIFGGFAVGSVIFCYGDE